MQERIATELRKQRAEARQTEAAARKLEAEARNLGIDAKKSCAEIAKLEAEERKLRNEHNNYESWLKLERVKAWGGWVTVVTGFAAIFLVVFNLYVFWEEDERKTNEIIDNHLRDLASENAGIRAAAAIALQNYTAHERYGTYVQRGLAIALADERAFHVQRTLTDVLVGFGPDAVESLLEIRSQIFC